MAAVALIKFVQGLNIGLNGQVLVGVAGTSVAISNVSNTDVASWKIDLVYVPPGSAVPVALPLAFNNASSTPAANFTPDVTGSYRIVLTVYESINLTGNSNSDIRNFVVPEAKHGGVVPPYQQDPAPKPTLASGAPGAKPNEMNIGGTELGWTGDGTEGLVAQQLMRLDGGIFDTDIGVTPPGTFVEVVGSSGDAPVFHPIHIASDGTRLVIPPGTHPLVVGGNVWVRINLADPSDYDWHYQTPLATSNAYLAPPAAQSLAYADLVSVGTDIWACGILKPALTDGFILKITSTGSLTVPATSPLPVVLGGEFPTSIDYDPTAAKLWTCSSAGNLVKIDPVTTAPTVYSAGAVNLLSLRLDQNAANHAGVKRGFVIDFTGSLVLRFRVDTGFTAEPSIAATTPRALAVGENFAGKVFVVEGPTTIRRYDKDLSGIELVGVYTSFFDEISWVDMDPMTNKLWVMGLSKTQYHGNPTTFNNCLVARVNATTLAVESLVELSTNSAGGISVSNGGSGLGPPPFVPRFRFFDGQVWVTDPQAVFFAGPTTDFGSAGFVCSLSGGGSAALATATDGSIAANTGVAGSIDSVYFGDTTISGLTGMSVTLIGQNIVITGATNPDNNGSFPITAFISATSVKYSNPHAVQGDTVTWTVGDPRWNSATSTFITAGILPGDSLVSNAFVWTVKAVNSQTQLTVTDPFSFGATASGITFSIFRPLVKQIVPVAGTKSLSLTDQSWKPFPTFFESTDGLAQLGDGVLYGRYRKIGDSVEVRVFFIRGTTTTFGSDNFVLPLPPEITLPHNQGTYGGSVNIDILQNFVTITALAGISTIPVQAIGPGLATLPYLLSSGVPTPGDSLILNYTLRVRKP